MDQKKLLLIVISVGAFLVVVVGAGLFIFAPPGKDVGIEKTVAVPDEGPAVPLDSQAYTLPAKAATGADLPQETAGAVASATADASSAALAPADASTWLKDPSTAPAPQAQANTRGDVIIIYGERPSSTITTGVDGRLIVPAPEAPRPAEPVPGIEDKNSQFAAPKRAPAESPRTASPPPKTSSDTAKAPAKRPAPTKQITVDEYWVQTGSFSVKGGASDVKSKLAAKGISSVIETKDVDGKTFYRVRVGPYASKPEAEYWLALVKTMPGLDGSFVTQKKGLKTIPAN